MKPRVVIVDDHTLFTTALGKLLEPDCRIVGSYSDAFAFLAEAKQIDPDIVILDIMMPSISGLQAAREIQRHIPRARLIFLTASDDPDVAAAASNLGAHAFVLKRSAGTELQAAIVHAMRGRNPPASAGTRGATEARDAARAGRTRPRLTERQREVLELLARGRSMKEAATILDVSVCTIAFHKYRMMSQLNIKSSAELIRFAVREGLT